MGGTVLRVCEVERDINIQRVGRNFEAKEKKLGRLTFLFSQSANISYRHCSWYSE